MKPTQYKFFLGLVIILGLIIAGLGISSVYQSFFPYTPFVTGQIRQTTSIAGHFTVSHPERWSFSQQPGNQGDKTIISAIDYPRISKLGVVVFFRRSTIPYTFIEQVANWGEVIANREIDYSEISITKPVFKGEVTFLREYSYTTSWNPLPFFSHQKRQCLGNYRLHHQIGYVITLCVESEDFVTVRPIFQDILESFAYQD